MKHLITRNGWYFYDRRVPARYAKYDNRQRIRVSLNTKCPRLALKIMSDIDSKAESYWNTLCSEKLTHNSLKFKSLVNTAKELGYAYVPAKSLHNLPIEEIVSRIMMVKEFVDKENLVKSTLGGPECPKINLSNVLELYWKYSKPLIVNKNSNQIRKWKNPRIKAVKNLINIVGNINISDLTNKHMIQLRDIWLERIKKEDIRPNSANKDFTHLKGILETVCTHEELDMNIDKLFKKIHLKDFNRSRRDVFSSQFIQNNLLKPEILQHLNDEQQNILYVSIETGARPIELLNLDGNNDINLECDVPYIHIRPRKGYSLKTRQSERKIPLVGKALCAFKKYPNGFTAFKGRPDQFSHHINAFLTKYGLKPSKQHTYYSLRHSFQDRLTALEIPDRIQCQLMGHKFNRPTYGKGASLSHLRRILGKTKLT